MDKKIPENVILFDGVCNLCNNSVQFVTKNDKKGVFHFASQQSEIGQFLMDQHKITDQSLKTMIYLKSDTVYTKSDAALMALKKLDVWYSFLYITIYIPKMIRDAVYNIIAANRYKWFGKRESCMIPTPELRSRFLDQ